MRNGNAERLFLYSVAFHLQFHTIGSPSITLLYLGLCVVWIVRSVEQSLMCLSLLYMYLYVAAVLLLQRCGHTSAT
jgi:hypothetical protein